MQGHGLHRGTNLPTGRVLHIGISKYTSQDRLFLNVEGGRISLRIERARPSHLSLLSCCLLSDVRELVIATALEHNLRSKQQLESIETLSIPALRVGMFIAKASERGAQ